MHSDPFSESCAISTRPVIEPFVAACVQAALVSFDTAKSLEKARALTAEAARTGARTILFPEAFIGGYPRGASFGAVVGSRTAHFCRPAWHFCCFRKRKITFNSSSITTAR
jgi:predicted amidohydrolase